MNPTLNILIHVLIVLTMLVGEASLVLVVIPGLVIIWAAALVYGVVTGFTWGSGAVFALLTVLMIFGGLVDNIIMGAKARQSGVEWWGVAAFLGISFIAGLVWTPLGGLLAGLLALIVIEVIRIRRLSKALNSARSVMVGLGLSVIIRLAIGGGMIALWAVWALFLR